MSGYFELKTSENGQLYFELKAGNGEIFLISEFYPSRLAPLNGIEAVRKCSQMDSQFDRRLTTNWRLYFALLVSDGRPLDRSVEYSGVLAMENGISLVTRSVIDGEVFDQTVPLKGPHYSTVGKSPIS